GCEEIGGILLVVPAKQEEERSGDESRIESVDLGDDRVGPEGVGEAEEPDRCHGRRRQTREARDERVKEEQAEGAKDGREEVGAKADVAEGQGDEETAEEDVEGVAGRMGDAKGRGGGREFGAVEVVEGRGKG